MLNPMPTHCKPQGPMREAEYRRFRLFLRASFPTLEQNPAVRFEDSWFYGALGEHVEAFVSGELRRIVVTTPAGTYKSRTWAVAAVAWAWLNDPWQRWLVGTNDESLGIQHSTDCRSLMRSAYYQLGFLPTWALAEDQDAKKLFANTEGGRRQVVSVGGIVGGKKGDRLILDDVHDAKRVHSPVIRKADKDWFRQSFFDRQVNAATSGIAVINHRTHRDDLANDLIGEGWPEFRLPERMEERLRKTFPLGGSDPRQSGEYLRPNRFGPEQERESKAVEGEAAWEAKRQQRPAAVVGSMFPSDKIRGILPACPAGIVSCIRYWDTASTINDTSCNTSGALIGRTADKFWVVIDVHRGKWLPHERDQEIKRIATLDRNRTDVAVMGQWVEEEGGGAGKTAASYFTREMSGFNVRFERPTGDKVVRATPFSSQWCAGNVYLVEGDWNAGYLDRMENFPGLADKDDTDASSGGFNVLALGFSPDVEPTAGGAPEIDRIKDAFRSRDIDIRNERF